MKCHTRTMSTLGRGRDVEIFIGPYEWLLMDQLARQDYFMGS